MKACIDCTPLLGFSGGVKTYLYHLVSAMQGSRGDRELTLFPFMEEIGSLHHPGSTIQQLPTALRLAYVQFLNALGETAMGAALRGSDVLHISNLLPTMPKKARVTTTLHDLTTWITPQYHTSHNVDNDQRVADQVLRKADAIIAVSNKTRDDAVRLLKIPEERLQVVYHGVASEYFRNRKPESQTPASTRWGIKRPYLLYVGTIEPRKNVDGLLDAYLSLSSSTLAHYDLVVAGPEGWSCDETIHRLKNTGSGVRYLGYVPEDDLPALFHEASVFVYPSLYEGFGLPLAQALAAETPTVVANTGALPEIAEGSSELVDPKSVGELAGAIERVLTTPALAERLVLAGRARAAVFAWERCAEETWKVLESTL